jgi:YD repeat-containing protein
MQRTKNSCNATSITCGTMATGSINVAGELDAVTFNASAGEVITLRAGSATSNFTPWIDLYDPNGQFVTSNSSENQINRSLDQTGSYTVIVRYWFGSSQTGGYRLTLQRTKNPCNATALACGAVVSGTIGVVGEVDAVTFNVAAGEVIRLGASGGTANPFDFTPWIDLYDPNGQFVTSSNPDNVINRSLPQAGTYTVIVRHWYGNQTGSYRLSLQRTKNPCNPTQIVECQTVKAVMNNFGEIDAFVFSRTAGQTAVLHLAGAPADFILYDPDGSQMASSGSPAIFKQAITKTGSHTLLAISKSDSILPSNYAVSLGNIKLFLSTPNGQEAFIVGSSVIIRWESTADNPVISSHDILLSTDGGMTYPITIASGLSAATQSYNWSIPSNLGTNRGRIRVIARDSAGMICQDASDADFIILGIPPLPKAVNYQYDELSRLTQVSYNDGATITYTYDALGNRLTEIVTISPTTSTLKIDSVIPPAGRTSGEQQIKLVGSLANLASVMVGGLSATWNYTNGTSEVTLTTPAHIVGAVDIVLTPTSGSPYTKSNAFAYLPTVFTDDTLVVGTTTAKAQHIIELRQAVDALRAVAGQGAAAWTDPTLSPTSTVIKAVHITELRSYLDQAAGAGTYTDPTLSSGMLIKRIHIEELRQRIRNIAG